ncbi:MFS transporter asaE [Yarrowia lipolytica]|nr:MFS transporter asaE [Yarrowia lipolytica]
MSLIMTTQPPLAGLDSDPSNPQRPSGDSSTSNLENSPTLTPCPPAFPDGGLEAWLQVLGGFCILFNSWGVTTTMGVYQSYYRSSLLADVPQSSTAWIQSIQIACIFYGGTLSGRFFDKGYLNVLVVGGSILTFTCYMVLAECTEYWHVLLCQGLGMGLGMGATFAPSMACVSQYFSKKRGLAIGICSAGAGVAGIVLPIMANNLLPSDKIGFAATTRALAGVYAGMAIIAICILRYRKHPAQENKLLQMFDVATKLQRLINRSREPKTEPVCPNDHDLEIGESSETPDSPATEKAVINVGAEKKSCDSNAPHVKKESKFTIIDLATLKNPVYVLFVIATSLAFLVLYIPYYYLQQFSIDHGMSEQVIRYTVTVLCAGATIGRVGPAVMADYLGKFNILVFVSMINGILLFCWMHLDKLALPGGTQKRDQFSSHENIDSRDAQVIVFAFFYGFFSGALGTFPPFVLPSLAPSMDKVGVCLGQAFLCLGTVSLVANPIAGFIIGKEGRYHVVAPYCGAVMMAACLLYVITRVNVGGWKFGRV